MCCSGDYFGICIFSMIWTLIQSVIHVSATIFGYYASHCKFRPTHVLTSIFYVTYFYQSECGPLTPVDRSGNYFWDVFITEDNKNKLSDFYDSVISVNDHFESDDVIARIQILTKVIFLCDCLWIISAASLGMGVLFRIKEKWCVLFYGSYILFTFIVSILDVVSTTIFAVDIPKTSNVTEWLDFMNIDNIDANSFPDVPVFYLNLPSIAMTAYASRLVIVWLINIACFFLVLRATIINSRLPFEQKVDVCSPAKRSNNADERIRTWQMFYEGKESTGSEDLSGGAEESTDRCENLDTTPISHISSNFQSTPKREVSILEEDTMDNFDRHSRRNNIIDGAQLHTSDRRPCSRHIEFDTSRRRNHID